MEWGSTYLRRPLRDRDPGGAGAGRASGGAVRARLGLPRPSDRPVTATPRPRAPRHRQAFRLRAGAARGRFRAGARARCMRCWARTAPGKSTLMHVAYGLMRPTPARSRSTAAGSRSRSPRDARRLGIGHGAPALHLGARADGGRERGARGRAGRCGRASAARARAAPERAARPPARSRRRGPALSGALKQRLEIVKALAGDARCCCSTSPPRCWRRPKRTSCWRVVRAFTARGGSAVLITHKLDEALAAADRVTVLRQGAVTARGPVGGPEPRESLAAAMIGGDRDAGAAPAPTSPPSAPPRLAARSVLGWRRSRCRGRAGTASRCGTRRSRSGRARSSGSPRSRGTGSASCCARWPAAPSAAGHARGRAAGRLHSGGPHHRRADPELSLTENVVLGLGRDDPWIRAGPARLARRRGPARPRCSATYEIVAPGPGRAGRGAQRRQPAEAGRGAGAGAAAARDRRGEPDPRARYPGGARRSTRRLRAAAAAGAAVLATRATSTRCSRWPSGSWW